MGRESAGRPRQAHGRRPRHPGARGRHGRVRDLLPQLTADFHARHPDVQIRVQGLNSSEVAGAERGGSLEAGLVQLPIDDQGLWVSAPVLTDTVVYVSADPARATTSVTVEELCRASLILSEARWARDHPLRRTLTERAQRTGVILDPAFEVEFQTAAVEFAVRCGVLAIWNYRG